MITRYQTQEMNQIFTESSRFEYMLKVEIEVAKAQAKRKIIPAQAYRDISKKSKIVFERIQEIEKTTKHDVIAFVSQVAETVGENGKYIHYGLTSSDVLDTALSLQMSDAFDVLKSEIKQLKL